MSDPAQQGRPPRGRWIKFAGQLVILLLVGWGIWRTMGGALVQLSEAGVRPTDLHPGWLALSGFGYLAGLYPCGTFWYRVLRSMRQRPGRWAAIRAYFASQPGKYVPGKVMVIVIRTALIRGPQVNSTLAAAATFVETLTMMSIGAAIGAVLMPLALDADWRLVAFALTSAVVVGIPTLPSVFRQVAKWTKLHRLHPEIDESLADLHIAALAPGWLGIAAGWFAMGVSLWGALHALPAATTSGGVVQELLLMTACAALSTVAGFASGLPGGLGAREWVVMALVAPQFGGVAAVLSAVIHRGVMIVTELLACVVVLLLMTRSNCVRRANG
ncbi:MAG: YbhN family protein [Pirellulaceae bacterium]